jgi:hypothetical protein
MSGHLAGQRNLAIADQRCSRDLRREERTVRRSLRPALSHSPANVTLGIQHHEASRPDRGSSLIVPAPHDHRRPTRP